LIAHNVLYV